MTFKRGDRVTATLWGEIKTGTVERHGDRYGSAVVWVRWEPYKNMTWVFPESLTLLPSEDNS